MREKNEFVDFFKQIEKLNKIGRNEKKSKKEIKSKDELQARKDRIRNLNLQPT